MMYQHAQSHHHHPDDRAGFLQQQKRRQELEKAMADALAGVAASLVSLWVFYPIHVLKINAQAADHQPQQQSQLWVQFHRLYAGIRLKSVETASSSFCYFYLYSWILSLYRHHQQQQRSDRRPPTTTTIPSATRLALAAVAAILNTLLTLPLEVLSTRQQQQQQQQHTTLTRDTSTTTTSSSSRSNRTTKRPEQLWASQLNRNEVEKDDDDANTKTSSSSSSTNADAVVSGCDSDEFMSDKDDDNDDTAAFTEAETTAASSLRHSRRLCRKPSELWEQGCQYPWKTLWKGLVPSLLLCSNPAINYTVFDVVKGWVLRQRRQRNTITTNNNTTSFSSNHKLTLMESFGIGLMAKLVSTVITYPLIRCKVRLMVQDDSGKGETGSSLWVGLCHEFRQRGVAGLYKGCNWQLSHTLLKSALLMMLRERIEGTTRRWLVVSSSSSDETGNSAS